MSDLSLIPLQDGYESQLSQDWDGNTGTVYVLATPSYTPTTTNTYIVVNPGKTNMQIAEITSYDSTAKTLTVSSISFEKGLGISSTAQSHSTGSKVIISDNYQFWEDIQTAVNSKLDKTGGNALVYATTTARDTALGANGVPTTPYTNIYVTDTGLFYDYNLSTAQWESRDTGTTPGNATTSSAGLVRSSVAPAGVPVALITDDDKYKALAGTSGTAPSASNKFVDNADTAETGASKVLRLTSAGKVTTSTIDTGVTDGKIIMATTGDKLPVIDGSNLTNITPTNVWKNGVTTTQINSASAVTISHGCGAVPKSVTIEGKIAENAASFTSSVGVYNGTTVSCIWSDGNGAYMGNSSTKIMEMHKDQSTNYTTWTIGIDATNITLTPTVNGTPGGGNVQILWKANT